ncbi:tetratricopeptide repeat protein [Sulfurospirillum multivorans]|uniref:TPR repeat-containing protein n=2 Tax=Sulfurospirillum multivorans TaxID=66821 RepID=A0AA86AK65_SULMK|nr:tetratricopeptide repeat protein [Sulfurospirillum multivorans]AHJ11387.1 TPR repeat-containing protein [Sulfurospirillum multivorans DSM 12446]QEH04891.1 TPR repeat-containing protein [Sulfurospirillum multivorans]
MKQHAKPHNDEIDALWEQALKFHKLSHDDEAQKLYEKLLTIQPHAHAYYNLGTIFQKQEKLEEAIEMYEKAIALQLNHANVYYNLGVILKTQNRFEEAATFYEKAIALSPDHANAYTNLGNIRKEQNRLEEAMALYEKAIALNPNNTNAHLNKSLILLAKGDLLEGFALYEKRRPVRSFSKPAWTGAESLEGKTLLIYSEQGFGDTIQFCRYIEMVAKLGCTVIFEVAKPLLPLMRQLRGVSCFVEKGEALPPFDLHCSLLSLPFAFQTTLESIPSKERYLTADPQKVADWQKVLNGTKPKVGLVWSGSETNKGDVYRSIFLETLLASLPKGFEYICLQKEVRQSDHTALENSPIRFLGESLHDFSDTAAVCSLMDLVVSVDTSVAHLAAALGKKTVVLLPFAPDWRWLLERNDSPWYPTIQLLRQETMDDWERVLQKLSQILLNFEKQ